MIIIISAMASNRVIGKDGQLPWNVPEEYEQYLNLVNDQTVLMGRRSYEIFKIDLTSKYNLVISRHQSEIEGARVYSGISSAIEAARRFLRIKQGHAYKFFHISYFLLHKQILGG